MEIRNEDIKKRINRKEIYRYLGYGTNTPDDNVNAMIKEVLTSLLDSISPRNIYKIFACSAAERIVVLKGENTTFAFESRNLAANLAQCRHVIMLAATLGLEADKLLQKYEILNMTKATITQACGAACIEAYCNILQEQICAEVSKDNTALYLRPRFSPGYGDFPLECQSSLVSALELSKRIGVTLTDSLLMAPSKSVTAVIGLSKKPRVCTVQGCEVCGKKDCPYRR